MGSKVSLLNRVADLQEKPEEGGKGGSGCSRRDFLKTLGVLLLGFNLPKSVSNILAPQEAQANTPEQNDFNQKFIEGEEGELKKLKEHTEINTFQNMCDIALSGVFFALIIPKFMSGDIAGAMAVSARYVGLWFLLSPDKHIKKHALEEIKEAFNSVLLMMAIITGAEGVKIDIDTQLQKSVNENFGERINTYKNPESRIGKMLKDLNIDFVQNAKEQGDKENIETVFIEKNNEQNDTIYISDEVFLEILPYLSRPPKHNDILSKISNYCIKEDALKIREILYKNIKNEEKEEDNTKPEITNEQEKEMELLGDIFMYEVSSIINFILMTQYIFGVGQTTLLKDKIGELGIRLRNASLARGMTSEEAEKMMKKFVNASISYLPNRLAYFSDLGPVGAVLAKADNKVEGLLAMLNGTIPIALINIVPYVGNTQNIVKEAFGLSKAPKTNVIQVGLKEFLKNTLLFPGILGQLKNMFGDSGILLAQKIELLNDNISGKVKLENDITVLNREVGQRNYPLIVSKKLYIGELKKDFSSLDTNIGISEIDNYFTKFQGDIDLSKGNNIVSYLFILKNKYDSGNEKEKKLITNIFRKHFTKIKNFFEILEEIDEEMHHHNDSQNEDREKESEKNTNTNIHSLKNFLSGFIDLPEKEQIDEKDIKNSFFTLMAEDLLKHGRIIEKSDFFYTEDIELCTEKNTIKIGGAKTLSHDIIFNIEFLSFLKNDTKYTSLFNKYKEIFKQNLLLIENKTKNSFENGKQDDFEALGKISQCSLWLQYDLSSKLKNFFNNDIIGENEQESFFSRLKETLSKDTSSNKEESEKNETLLRQALTGFGLEKGSIEKFIHHLEGNVGKNSFEVFQMIFLIQTPYVVAVKNTIANAIKMMTGGNTSQEMKEYLIALGTYIISMFADNYVGLVVGIELAKDILGMDAKEAIQKFTKYAIYGGSKVITGNSPNALFDKKMRDDFYLYKNISLVEDKENKENDINFQLFDTYLRNLYFSSEEWNIHEEASWENHINPDTGVVFDSNEEQLENSIQKIEGILNNIVGISMSTRKSLKQEFQKIKTGYSESSQEELKNKLYNFREKLLKELVLKEEYKEGGKLFQSLKNIQKGPFGDILNPQAIAEVLLDVKTLQYVPTLTGTGKDIVKDFIGIGGQAVGAGTITAEGGKIVEKVHKLVSRN